MQVTACPRISESILQGAAVAIWTTTGWTIPANQAVAVNERLQYAIVEAQACSSSTLHRPMRLSAHSLAWPLPAVHTQQAVGTSVLVWRMLLCL